MILGILILSGMLYWLSREDSDAGMLKKLKNEYEMQYADTAAVDKIIISDKTPKTVTLIKTQEGWMIENGLKARKDAIDVILETLHRMRLKNFVPQNARDNVIRRMSSAGKEVAVYANGKLVQNFVVGTETMDEMGTYMMKVGADNPYAMHIPGFNGFLSTRFFANELLWTDRTLFGYDNLDIAEVTYQNSEFPNTSFVLKSKNQGFELTDLLQNKTVEVDTLKAAIYLASFRTVKFEGVIVEDDDIWARQDSLKASTPVFTLKVTRQSGAYKQLTAYKIKGAVEFEELYGREYDFDPDRVHAFIRQEDGREIFVLAQYFGLGPSLTTLQELQLKKQ